MTIADKHSGLVLMLLTLSACQSQEAPPTELLNEPLAVESALPQPEMELLEITPPELHWKATDPTPQESFEYDFSPFIPPPGARGPRPDEAAVGDALQWLLAQQAADGGWSFDSAPGITPWPHELCVDPSGLSLMYETRSVG